MTSEPPVPPEGAPAPRGQVPFELSEAFNYGWLKFQQNVGPILVATLVLIVGAAAVSFIWYLVTLPFTAMDPEDISDVGAVGFLFTGAVFAIVFVLVGFIVQAGIGRVVHAVAAQAFEGRWADQLDEAREILAEAGVILEAA